ncbi:MAG: amidohydrolase family protein [Planctomycetaceae bacterium]|nr:amidohydrolase family protein [Planctomycetaceae bacterium]
MHAITNLRLVVKPGELIDGATLIVRDGLIEAAGKDVVVPEDARVWDGTGKTAYAGFIDAYSEIEPPAVPTEKASAHWNTQVTPQISAVENYAADAAPNRAFREQGFVARLVAPNRGILKGQSGVVTTGTGGGDRAVIADGVAQHVRLTAPRGRGESDYPNSPMGAVALARQTLYDARWYRDAWKMFDAGEGVARPERNDAFASLTGVLDGETPIIADAMDDQYALRADLFAKEFDLKLILRSYGHEYRRLDAIAATKRPVIVSLDFPKPPEVSTPETALDVSLERLMHWDLAPENPGRLSAAGVPILLSGSGLEKRSDFWPALRKAIRRGLDKNAALTALTVTPAETFGLTRSGTLEPGKAASFVLTTGDPFVSDEAKFVETWVDGERYEIEAKKPGDLRGAWSLTEAGQPVGSPETSLSLTGESDKLKGSFRQGDKKADLKDVKLVDGRLSARFDADKFEKKGVARLTATVTLTDGKPSSLVGSLVWPDESVTLFSASQTPREAPKNEDRDPVVAQKPKESKKASFAVNFPLGEYGRTAPAEQPAFIAFTNATVWTCSPEGVLEGATVLVEKGVIKAVGKDVEVPSDALVVDCAGKHLSPGLIDCHSHMGTDGGINESTQSVTSEVRIGDFINATDIDIYHQLAGGLTTSNILHGSANTIGGQNQVIKLRWGLLPEELKFAEAPPGIKFALGENVKQSNWGENYTTRYPQTRMGVEQIIRDRFLAAREYRHRHEQYAKTKQGLPPRVDLELEAIAQVVYGERWVHCHSYRQDEILALLRTLDEFGVTIGTLQHILEGYKVADEMQKHGAGGSSFSDWWAYKFEVYDAIPFGGALMHQNGVVVSFNSDDRELARHLNHEAAKAVKYGGVEEEAALKFVTLNPAKQLRIDQHVGSLEPGKHADLVVWSGKPLSNLSVCEQTWIDGRKYFDRAESRTQTDEVRKLRAVLIQKALASGEKSAKANEEEPMERDLWPKEDMFCKCRLAQ